jgi:two-component system, sensor histidine kinase and response regulator
MPTTIHTLVVDDEMGMRMGVQRALRDFSVRTQDMEEEARFEITLAETGEAAVELLDAGGVDLLLLDHKLPGISGLDVLEHLVEQQSQVLTVMMTAYASIETAITATKRGAYDFLAKPFTPEELRIAVAKATHHLVIQRQARQLASERRQVRFQFISVLAHELKSPLAAVEGYLNILRDPQTSGTPEAQQQMLDRCMMRLGGMRKLILDLLDLTRIESGTRERQIADVDLRELAQGAIELMQGDAQARAIAVDLQADGACVLQADRAELEIVFNNLVSNAVKYNRDGGRVDIALTELPGGGAQIVVRDTGIGLTEAECALLFKEFSRVKNAKTKRILGSGLGLSTVKKIAELYGGTATVQSVPGEGSTFTVTLQP